MNLFINIVISFVTVSVISCANNDQQETIQFGNEILISEHLNLLDNKKVGIVTNHTSLLPQQVHLVDTLNSLRINIIALFSPEHGIRGNVSRGVNINSSFDKNTGIPVYSLYGKVKKPIPEMLSGVDILLYDIQDVGVRFYSYISTLYYVLEASAENDVPIIVLDRPNPLNGARISGPVLIPAFKSFIGIEELPIIYGMTIGELAKLFKDELGSLGKNLKLKVIPARGWSRDDSWNELNREWIPTSPNISSFETAFVYPGTCFLEGTNISEGRGTDRPFLTIGAPFIDSEKLTLAIETKNIPGITITESTFIPAENQGIVINPKYEGAECHGITISISDYKAFNPVNFGIHLLCTLIKLYPDKFKFDDKHFDLLAGTDSLRKDILSGKTPEDIISGWNADLEEFNLKRKKYLIY